MSLDCELIEIIFIQKNFFLQTWDLSLEIFYSSKQYISSRIEEFDTRSLLWHCMCNSHSLIFWQFFFLHFVDYKVSFKTHISCYASSSFSSDWIRNFYFKHTPGNIRWMFFFFHQEFELLSKFNNRTIVFSYRRLSGLQ